MQQSAKHVRELRIPIVVLAVDLFTDVRSGNVPNPTGPRVRGSDWPSPLLPALPPEAPASEQRRRLCGRQSFLTSTQSVRSGNAATEDRNMTNPPATPDRYP